MTVPKVVGIKPCGTSVLVELLNTEEILGTNLEIVTQAGAAPEASIDGAPQAYVLEVGPRVEKEWGFKKGDRVMFSGMLTPAPSYDKSKRARGTLDPHSIKAILKEAKK
jgi:hypothetical protein